MFARIGVRARERVGERKGERERRIQAAEKKTNIRIKISRHFIFSSSFCWSAFCVGRHCIQCACAMTSLYTGRIRKLCCVDVRKLLLALARARHTANRTYSCSEASHIIRIQKTCHGWHKNDVQPSTNEPHKQKTKLIQTKISLAIDGWWTNWLGSSTKSK